VDCTALDVGDLERTTLVGNGDSGQFFSLFSENLDALVIAVEVERVVGGLFTVEVDGRGSRRLGILRHLQFLVGGRLELGAEQGWGCNDGEAKRKTNR
jgi:hypothetical protein